MAKVEATVEELVGMIQRGELRLPEMQRRYVWRATRVRDLLDSLYRGYPSGAILLWETDEDVPQQAFAVSQQQNPYQSIRLLLDGQQRLTSLSAVIRGEPLTVRGRRRPVDILFNLEHPEHLAVVTEVEEDGAEGDEDEVEANSADSSEDEILRRFERMAFVVATRKLEQSPHWVRVTDVFKANSDASFLRAAGIQDLEDPRYDKYSKRLARLRGIRHYAYRMDVLERTLSYDEVTEIFVRVNSLGAKLRSSDLALAQITAKWRGALGEFQRFEAECALAGFPLDVGLHVKNLVIHATGQSRFLTIGSLSVEKLKAAWAECQPAMQFAINFLRNNVGADSPALLASPFLILSIAFYAHQRGFNLGADEARQLRHWALLANAKGRYSRGSSETILDQDIAIMRDGGGVSLLLDRLRQQVGRLDVTPEELEGRTQRSSLFKTMFLAFRERHATDWRSNLRIALDHSGVQHRLQFHHIFPKNVLRPTFTAREADDIANLAFVSGRTNRQISDKAPSAYLPGWVDRAGNEAFAAQCIPLESELLGLEAYNAFLAERRQRISRRLNEFLGAEEPKATTREQA